MKTSDRKLLNYSLIEDIESYRMFLLNICITHNIRTSSLDNLRVQDDVKYDRRVFVDKLDNIRDIIEAVGTVEYLPDYSYYIYHKRSMFTELFIIQQDDKKRDVFENILLKICKKHNFVRFDSLSLSYVYEKGEYPKIYIKFSKKGRKKDIIASLCMHDSYVSRQFEYSILYAINETEKHFPI
jgi:hypothetical protein